MAEVIGAAFLGVIRHIKDKLGEGFLREVVEEAGEETQKVFSRKIITIAWHPYPSYVNLLKTVDRKMGKGDFKYCRDLGKVAAARDLETIYSMYKEQARPERLIQDADIIWRSYYRNAGSFSPVSADPKNTVLRITDFPGMSPAHCRLMEGWMNEVMRLAGANMIQEIRETMCTSRGDPYHEFKCVWE